jgi:hypothetical protein
MRDQETTDGQVNKSPPLEDFLQRLQIHKISFFSTCRLITTRRWKQFVSVEISASVILFLQRKDYETDAVFLLPRLCPLQIRKAKSGNITVLVSILNFLFLMVY